MISVLLCSLLALYIGLYTAYLFQHQLMPSSSSTNVRSKKLLAEVLGRLLFVWGTREGGVAMSVDTENA